MANLIAQIRSKNGLGTSRIVEPFAGGAGASLNLLFREEVPRVHLNDADPAIHDFWWAITNQTTRFLRRLNDTPLTIAEWCKQRDLYKDKSGRVSRSARGFATFYLNRTNRSGIVMNGGPIGGHSQAGKWKLDARFNKAELSRRIESIAANKDRISLSCEDGRSTLTRLSDSSTFFFIDPPYFEKGGLLYLNSLDPRYHEQLATQLRSMRNTAWVTTYDDCPQIRRLYDGWATVRPFGLQYAAATRRKGQEVLIAPKWMRLPEQQTSDMLVW
jgi:DNA adenine methylase